MRVDHISADSMIAALDAVGESLTKEYNLAEYQKGEELIRRRDVQKRIMTKRPEGFEWNDEVEGYNGRILIALYGNGFNTVAGLPNCLNSAADKQGTGFHQVIADRVIKAAIAIQHGVGSDMLDVLDI